MTTTEHLAAAEQSARELEAALLAVALADDANVDQLQSAANRFRVAAERCRSAAEFIKSRAEKAARAAGRSPISETPTPNS